MNKLFFMSFVKKALFWTYWYTFWFEDIISYGKRNSEEIQGSDFAVSIQLWLIAGPVITKFTSPTSVGPAPEGLNLKLNIFLANDDSHNCDH